jgi:outer membrane biosynthesis protein TonB
MLGASVAAHVALFAVFVLGPAWWFGARHEPPETVMQISLGGPESPDTSGLTSLSARPVQQVVPVEPKKPVEAVRPPAAKTPEMVLPTKTPPRKTTPNQREAKDPRSTTTTKGAELQKGSAVAPTNAKGQGFGLSSGGFGANSYLDVANFCCPEYLGLMQSQIRENWDNHQNASALVLMKFAIQRDGRIVDVVVEKSSGVETLDFIARRALLLTQLPPLPAGYPEPALVVHLYFEYQR